MNEQQTYHGQQSFKIGEVILQAWEYTKQHLGFFIGYLIIMLVVSLLFSGIAQALAQQGRTFLAFLMHTAGWILGLFIQMGLINSALLITTGIKPEFNQLYSNDRYFGSYLVSTILFNLMVMVGFILLIIPGVYLAVRYILFSYFVLDKEMRPIESLEAAAKATQGKRGFLFLLLLVLLLLNAAGALLFGIGLFVTIPISVLSLAIVYRKLTRPDHETTLITDAE